MSLIQDPSAGTAANVKPASTAPLTTDQALVVTVSPNTPTLPVSIASATVNQGTPNTAANSWPVEVTDGTNVLGTSSHPVRVDPTGVTTQPVSGTVTANQGGTWTVQPGNTANTTPWLSTINQGGNSATVSAAGSLKIDGSAVTQPISATSLPLPTGASTSANQTNGSQLTQIVDASGNVVTRQNRTAALTTLGILPTSGLDGGIMLRATRVDEIGTERGTSETLLWHDAFESATINTFWVQSLTTMTAVQATGVLTLNNSAITTLNTDAIITSQRQFQKLPRMPLFARFRGLISANVASNHTLVELGFGAPSGVTAVINNGAFFRWTAAGNLNAVISYNGTETSNQVLAQGVISTTSYYNYDVILDKEFARFVVTDSNGTPVVDSQFSFPVTTPFATAVSHLPSFARVYVDATGGGTAIQLKLAAHSVQILDAATTKSWEEQAATVMRHASINPTTYTQTGSTMTAAPATETPSNTAGGYNALGGDYAIAMTVASENPLSVFGFQIPSPYSFYLRGLTFSTPFVTTALSVTTAPMLEWLVIANCASGNISTGGGQRFPVGLNTLYTSQTQAAGSFLTVGGTLTWAPQVPILCLPGTFLHFGYKVFFTTAAGTPGVTRGSIFVDGYFE